MKRLLIVLILALLVAIPNVFATGCGSGSDEFGTTTWCIDDSGTLIPTTSGGQRYVTQAYSSVLPQQLTSDDTGKIIVDYGNVGSGQGTTVASSCSKHVLPLANVVGLTYTLVTGNICTTTLDTLSSTDVIVSGDTGTTVLDPGDSLRSPNGAGKSITVTTSASGKWNVVNMQGSWQDNGAN